MKQNKKRTKWLVIFCMISGLLLVASGVCYQSIPSFQSDKERKIGREDYEEKEQDTSFSKEEKEEEKKEEEPINVPPKEETVVSPDRIPEEKKEEPPTEASGEDAVVAYFSLQSDTLDLYQGEKEKTGLLEKVKSTFITVIDFLFYDKEIKGYTFSELSQEAKLKVLKLALTIDHKIDDYFPNYKNTIKSGYENMKEKMISLYLSVTSNLCDKMSEDACNQAKEDFNTMKENFGYTFEMVKEAGKEIMGSISDWYLDFSGKK